MNPSNQDTSNGVIISERTTVPTSYYKRVGITFLVLALITGITWSVAYYFVAPQQYMAEAVRQLETRISDIVANDPGVQFVVVPEAASTTLLSPLEPQPLEVLESDYVMALDRVVLDATGAPLAESIGDMMVGDTRYEQVANTLPSEVQATLFQMHDEVREVARVLGAKNNIEPLAVRIGRSESLLYPNLGVIQPGSNPVVFPSPYALEGYLVTEILARAYPELASYYQQRGQEYVVSGVAFGHYSIAEKDAMKMYIDWYIAEAEKNPLFTDLIKTLREGNNQFGQ